MTIRKSTGKAGGEIIFVGSRVIYDSQEKLGQSSQTRGIILSYIKSDINPQNEYCICVDSTKRRPFFVQRGHCRLDVALEAASVESSVVEEHQRRMYA